MKSQLYTQSIVQARVDADLEKSAAAIYEAIGIDLPTAIRMFFKRTLIVGGLPFDAVLPESEFKGKSFSTLFDIAREQAQAGDLTEDDVEREIAASRRSRRSREKSSI